MKQILITGASTGIGFDATKTLLEKGYRVWAGVRRPESLERLQADFGDRLSILKLDVTNPDQIKNAFQQIKTEWNPQQELILINNAGVAGGGPVEGLPLQEWLRVFEINLFAMIEMTRVFLPLIRESKGRVINIGSISGRIASPFLGPYCASKFAVRAFSDSLRREMVYFGVQVSLIEPGPIRTEIWTKSVRESDELSKSFSPEIQSTYGRLMESLRQGVVKAAEGAVPVQLVTEKILDAIESKSPKANYLVGKHIQLQASVAQFLPASLVDKVVRAGMRFQKG